MRRAIHRQDGAVMRLTQTAVLAACLTVGVSSQAPWKPAKLLYGTPPIIPVQAVAGGEVFLEATVSKVGQIDALVPLRATPPFTANALEAVSDWRFQPAEGLVPRSPDDTRPMVLEAVESKVFIACVFRPPTLNSPTLGEPPKDVKAPSDDVAFPLSTVTPPYPPMALADAVVVVQVTVGITGQVLAAATVRSAAGFDEPALAAARQWTFRPARVRGRLEESFAYLVFGFRRPVV